MVGLAYAAGSQFAMLIIDIWDLESVFFIPAGITVAFLLRLQKRLWWVVIAAAGLTEMGMDLMSAYSLEQAVGFALANSIEPLAGALVVVTFLRQPLDLARLRHVSWFVVGAVLIGPAIGAGIGALTDTLLGGADLLTTFWQWWLGDALAVILVGGAILVWGSSPDRRSLVSPGGIGLVVLTGVLTIGVHLTTLPLTFLVLIVVVLAGATFGVRAVAMVALLVSFLMAIRLGIDPDGLVVGVSESAGLVVIKLQLAVFTVAGLLVAGEAHERVLATSTAVLATTRAQVSEAEHRTERRIALRLQEALLPATPMDHPRISMAARYEAGSEALLVGGDWYDVFDLPGARIGLTVGDVVGHGLEATAAMGRLRTAVAALAPHIESPGDLLTALDRFAQLYGQNRYATAAYGLFDPATGRLRYASAGHPPFLVVEPDGGARWLEEGRSSPLHEVVMEGRAEAAAVLEPGSLLVGYTDGLVERRGESLEVGLERLRQAVISIREQSVEVICDLLIEQMGVGTQRADDVVALVLRYELSPVLAAEPA